MSEHETDWQRRRRQRNEVKKYGITGSTPEDAVKRIKEHVARKMGGHKHGEREARSKKAGYYVHGHKNYGDVYEA